MPLAVLDLGSNSFHLTLVAADRLGRPEVLDRVKNLVRLGDGVEDGLIAPGAWARADTVIGELLARARRGGHRAAGALRTNHVVITAGTARTVRDLTGELDGAHASVAASASAPAASASAPPPGDRRAASSETRAVSVSEVRRLTAVLGQFRPTNLTSLGVTVARTDTVAVGAVVMAATMDLLGVAGAAVPDRGLRDGLIAREQQLHPGGAWAGSGEAAPSQPDSAAGSAHREFTWPSSSLHRGGGF